MIHLLDQNEQIIDVLVNSTDNKTYWDTKITEDKEDNLLTFDFTTLGNISFENVMKITAQDQDGNHRLFVISDIQKSHDENGLIQIVSADGAHVELGKDQPIMPQTLAGQTAETAVRFVLQSSQWQVGQVDFLGSRTITFTDFLSPLAALHQIASDFGGVLRFRVEIVGNKIERYVDLLDPPDDFSGKEFEFGKDIVGLKRKENRANIVTRLVGYGPADENGNYITFESINGGKNYVEDLDAYQRWNDNGRHLYSIFQYQPEDTTNVTPQAVLDATKKELKNRINAVMEYELTGAALEQITGYDHEKVRLGMKIRAKDTSFEPPLYVEAEVFHTEMPELDDKSDDFSYTFGNYHEVTVVVPPEIKAIQKTLFRNANAWTAAKSLAAQALQDAAKAQATADGKITSFYQPDPPETASEGDLWFDTNDGNKPYIWQNGGWQPAQDNGIAEALNRANDAQATADKKVQTFFSDTAPTAEGVGDLWYNPASGTLFRWDGSGWLVVSDVTGMNTAADTAAVNGRPAGTVLVDIQSAQSTANTAQTTATNAQNTANAAQSTISANKSIWDRGSFFNSDGTLDVSKLKGFLSDSQIASAAKWNGRTTMITDSGVYTGTILASQIIADSLSAISANLGTITSGTLDLSSGLKIQGSGSHRVTLDNANVNFYYNNKFTGRLTGNDYGSGATLSLEAQDDVQMQAGGLVFGDNQAASIYLYRGGTDPVDGTIPPYIELMSVIGGTPVQATSITLYPDTIQIGGVVDMTNHDIVGVNSIHIADPGGSEGIIWDGGNGFKIVEAPNDLSNGPGNLHIVQNGSSLINFGKDSTSARIQSYTIYNRTYSGSANVFITEYGTLGRVTSAKKYKEDIQEVPLDNGYAERILELKPKSWFDKTDISENGGSTEGLRRHYGLLAEDVVDVGLPEYVVFKDNEVEGLEYDRLWTLLIPVTADHHDRIAWLETENDYLKQYVTYLENRLNELEAKIA